MTEMTDAIALGRKIRDRKPLSTAEKVVLKRHGWIKVATNPAGQRGIFLTAKGKKNMKLLGYYGILD